MTDFVRLALDDPPRTLRYGADLQRWRIRVRPSSAADVGDFPTIRVELQEAGEFRAISLPDTPVSEETVLGCTWDAQLLSDGRGVDVEALLVAERGSGGASVEIASFGWIATVLAEETTLAHSDLSARWEVLVLAGSMVRPRWQTLSNFRTSEKRTFRNLSPPRLHIGQLRIPYTRPSTGRVFLSSGTSRTF